MLQPRRGEGFVSLVRQGDRPTPEVDGESHVNLLQRWRLWRAPAVIVTVLAALGDAGVQQALRADRDVPSLVAATDAVAKLTRRAGPPPSLPDEYGRKAVIA